MAAPKFSDESAARPTGWNRSIFVFGAELKTDGRIGADFADRPPQGEQFFRLEQHARLIRKIPAEVRLCARRQTTGTPNSSNFENVLPEKRKCLFIALLGFQRSHVDREAVLHVGLEAAARRLR